jgi:Fe-S cluster assembly protein SufD
MTNEQTYLANFETFTSGRGANAPAWLQTLRKNGIDSFSEQGFPTHKTEAWRFTRLRPLLQNEFTLADPASSKTPKTDQLEQLAFADGDCRRMVFVDGHYSAPLSSIGDLPGNVMIMSLKDALTSHGDLVKQHLGRHAAVDSGPFVALNTGHIQDGAFVYLPKGTELAEPIHLLFVSSTKDPFVAHPRNLVVAEENTRASIIETYTATSATVYFNNVVSEIIVGDNAEISHYKVQKENHSAYHIASLAAHLGRDTRFSTEFVSLGSALVRNDVDTVLDGEGIDATLNGLYMANEHQHVDNHTNIEHARPHCDSHELYKGILAGRAKAVFNGKIHVHQDAQKTDAKQSNGCMLLSDDAQINTNPQLEIYADDVKCTHGAVVGQIDDNAIFYLRSRGIAERDARHMLVFAFANEVLARVRIPSLRERLEADLSDWLDGAQAA